MEVILQQCVIARILLMEGIAAREMKSVKPRAPWREEW
jgi:hypothetical protein